MKRTTDSVLIEWLVLGAQAGDQDAMSGLVEIMYPKLLRYASRLIGDADAAQDMVQSAFEVLSRDLRKVKDPAAFSAWLYRITHNKCIDLIRRQQTRRAGEADLLSTMILQQSKSIERSAPASEDTLWLERILTKLNSEQYQLVHLYYLEGFSLREVARTLGVAEGTVKSRLFKLRNKLKPLLTGDSDE